MEQGLRALLVGVMSLPRSQVIRSHLSNDCSYYLGTSSNYYKPVKDTTILSFNQL